MLWPESETIAAELSGTSQLVQRIDSVLAENTGAIVPLDLLRLFARASDRELFRILVQYEKLGVVEKLRIATCPDHSDVFTELNAQAPKVYCDQCEKEIDANSWIESIAYRVAARDFPKREPLKASSDTLRFQVALSFPGEHRELVRAIAGELAQIFGRTQVLFDEYYTAEFARPNLDTHLQELYFNQSQLVVVFLCAAYEKSQWCGLEWRAIRTMIKQHRDEQIMFIRLDDGDVKGIFEIDGFVDAQDKSAKQIAELVCERV